MSVYIKDMDMPTDCLACRIACDKENYGVIGRPPKCPLEEAAAGDLISRADAIEVVAKEDCCGWIECKADKIYGSLNALPSADAVSREDYHNLLTASNDIDRALREYQAKEEQTSAEAEWIPCSKELPKENGEYIVSLEDSVYPWAKFFNGKWFMLSINAIAREFGEYEVIAWMPLPDPYREDGEV